MFNYEIAPDRAQTEKNSDIFHELELGTDRSTKVNARVLRSDDENPLGIDVEKDAKYIAKFLNLGRADLAVSALSNDLIHLRGNEYNRLLLKVSENELPEEEGDDRAHLLLSDWNKETGTWNQVYVSERDQLYRFVQPGNTLVGIAADRLGAGADKDAIAKYAKNIAEQNSIPHPELILRGQALKLPYPY